MLGSSVFPAKRSFKQYYGSAPQRTAALSRIAVIQAVFRCCLAANDGFVRVAVIGISLALGKPDLTGQMTALSPKRTFRLKAMLMIMGLLVN